jgi:hypothetical protein
MNLSDIRIIPAHRILPNRIFLRIGKELLLSIGYRGLKIYTPQISVDPECDLI